MFSNRVLGVVYFSCFLIFAKNSYFSARFLDPNLLTSNRQGESGIAHRLSLTCELLPSAQLGLRLGKDCIRVAPEVYFKFVCRHMHEFYRYNTLTSV